MNRTNTFLVPGARVKFKNNGDGTVIFGTIKRVNAKTVTVTQCSDGSPGWRVHPLALSPAGNSDPGVGVGTAPPALPAWQKGARVAFSHQGRTVVGTIVRVNARTCSIIPDAPVRAGQYYRVAPVNLRMA
jgi:hypothetical protein